MRLLAEETCSSEIATSPLYQLCWDLSVTANNIKKHHYDKDRTKTKDKPQFTPFYPLLAANPSVTGDMITTYLHSTKMAPVGHRYTCFAEFRISRGFPVV